MSKRQQPDQEHIYRYTVPRPDRRADNSRGQSMGVQRSEKIRHP